MTGEWLEQQASKRAGNNQEGHDSGNESPHDEGEPHEDEPREVKVKAEELQSKPLPVTVKTEAPPPRPSAQEREPRKHPDVQAIKMVLLSAAACVRPWLCCAFACLLLCCARARVRACWLLLALHASWMEACWRGGAEPAAC